MFILAPFGLLVMTLFLRVIVGLFSVESGVSDNTALTIITAILNFIALICVIGIVVLTPLGLVLLLRKGETATKIGNEVLAERGTRWLAKFIDGLLIIPAFVIALVIISIMGADPNDQSSDWVFWVILFILFAIQAYYLTVEGQSLGKRWLKIRIVDAETQRVGGFSKNVLVRSVLNFILSFVPVYGLVDVLFIFREDRRCVHDLMAGTIVVNAKGAVANKEKLHTGKSASAFCTNCGTKSKPSAKFCVSCGKSLH